MITVNGNSIQEINSALLSLQQSNTIITNNSTATVTNKEYVTESIDTSTIYSLIKANASNILNSENRISSIEGSISDMNALILNNESNIAINTNAIAILNENFTYWQNFLPYRFYASDNTINLTNGYGNTQSIEIGQWTNSYLPLTGGTLTGDLTVKGNIYQTGSEYETHAEQVYTKDNTIILRDGAVSGMSSGEYAGFKALLYDGTNNGYLVFDNVGTAYVGDEGSLQPLTTRDPSANMTDGHTTYWDATTSSIKTSSSLPGLTQNSLTLITGNTYSADYLGTATFDGGTAVTKNIYQPNQELNTTSSPTFWSTYFNSSSVKAYDITSTTSMDSGDVIYDTLKFTGAVTANVEFTLYFDSSTLSGRKTYHIINECTSASGTYTLTLKTGTGTISTSIDIKSGGGFYLKDVFVDSSGNVIGSESSGGGSISYPLTISSSILSTGTSYDGSANITIYSPGQLLEAISKPTFSGITLNGNNIITSSSTLSLTTSGSEPLTISDGTLSIGLDSSNIQSRSGTSASALNINKLGGNLNLCAGGGQINCASAGALIIPTKSSTVVGSIWVI